MNYLTSWVLNALDLRLFEAVHFSFNFTKQYLSPYYCNFISSCIYLVSSETSLFFDCERKWPLIYVGLNGGPQYKEEFEFWGKSTTRRMWLLLRCQAEQCKRSKNNNNDKKSSVTTCMSLRPFICNWLTRKEAFKCISVIVKTHKSADPLVEVSDFVHLQTLTRDTYWPVIISAWGKRRIWIVSR